VAGAPTAGSITVLLAPGFFFGVVVGLVVKATDYCREIIAEKSNSIGQQRRPDPNQNEGEPNCVETSVEGNVVSGDFKNLVGTPNQRIIIVKVTHGKARQNTSKDS